MDFAEFSYAETEPEQELLWESHCHPSFEIIAILSGTAYVTAEGKKHRLFEHTVAVIPPLLYHTVTASRKSVYRRVTTLFDVCDVPAVLRDAFLSACTEILIFPSALPTAMKAAAKGEYYAPLRASLLTEAMYTAVANGGESRTHGEVDRFLESTLRYIDTHLEEPILLDDVAAAAARSKSSLCHLFRLKMNISLKQYILEKKLALAAKLIREGVPPTLAAARIGYENYSNFYRMYRRKFGCAPSGTEA